MDKNDDHVVAVAAGHASSFVVTNRGEVYSWGSRMFGALGQDGEDNKDNEKKKANDRDREKKRAQEAEEGDKQEKNDKVVLAPRLITGTQQTVGTSRRVRCGRVAAVPDSVRGVGGVCGRAGVHARVADLHHGLPRHGSHRGQTVRRIHTHTHE